MAKSYRNLTKCFGHNRQVNGMDSFTLVTILVKSIVYFLFCFVILVYNRIIYTDAAVNITRCLNPYHLFQYQILYGEEAFKKTILIIYYFTYCYKETSLLW